ncbi:MAG: molybdopterin molybdotransferase MoeA, partial [Pseudomonadota bacterium]
MTGRLPNDCFALPPGVRWTPVDDALDHLEQRLGRAVGTETRVIGDAAGRVLAVDVTAPRAHPPTANAAVDGYAVQGDGVQFELLLGRAAAGDPFMGHVGAGQAVRILTGASIPAGVDRVVLQEDVEVQASTITLTASPKPGANMRKAGEDMARGQTILQAGCVLTPADIGILATVGLGDVLVHRRLKVAVISTGDELRPAGQGATDHQIYDANRPMLVSLLRGWGFDVVDMGIIPDDRAQVRFALDRAAQADAIITSGGASAGDAD